MHIHECDFNIEIVRLLLCMKVYPITRVALCTTLLSLAKHDICMLILMFIVICMKNITVIWLYEFAVIWKINNSSCRITWSKYMTSSVIATSLFNHVFLVVYHIYHVWWSMRMRRDCHCTVLSSFKCSTWLNAGRCRHILAISIFGNIYHAACCVKQKLLLSKLKQNMLLHTVNPGVLT